jgi:hypothetical protein
MLETVFAGSIPTCGDTCRQAKIFFPTNSVIFEQGRSEDFFLDWPTHI